MSRKTFEQIVAGVLDRRVVPFVGAGVSFSARLPEDGSGKPHKTPEMIRALRRALGLKEEPRQDDSLAELCERYLWRRQSQGDRAYDQLVDDLRIAAFARLQPAPAHRYLAFLAREGFIGEVFTTNYDACLERAYLESWGIQIDLDWLLGVPAEHDGEEEARLRAQVEDRMLRIWDLESYRAGAGLTAEKCVDDGRRIPARLKIYKLNGCACELLRPDAEEQCRARDILLTEVQLQDFRQRAWARDLFRDRVRSRSLLFCGFGSPEPQVRHTVIQVLEELSGLQPTSTAPPNRPFVVCYTHRAEFHQRQIANAFAACVDRKVRAAEGTRARDLIFHARDAKETWPRRQEELRQGRRLGLTADFFFEQLYRQVMVTQLRRLLHPRSSAVAQLRALLPGVDGLLQSVRMGLAEEGPSRPRGTSRLRLLEATHPTAPGTPRLALWLHALTSDEPPIPGCYVPLVGNEQLAVELLVVLTLCGAFGPTDEGHCPALRPDPDLGLEVTLPGWAAAGVPDPVFYLAAATHRRPAPGGELRPGARLRTQILLGCGERMLRPEIFDLRLREPGANGATGCLRSLHVARIALREVLRQVPPHRLGPGGARERLKRAVLAPSSVVDQRRPRVEQRLRRLEVA